MWRRNIGLPGPYRSRRCQFPFAQVFKPSERSAGFFKICVVLWLGWRFGSGDVCAITRCSLFLVLFDDTKSAITQRKHKNWCENTRTNTNTCDVGTSYSPGRTALEGVTSLSRKCSRLQQVVRGFSSFALFCDWAGGFDQVMSALSRDVHCFWFCSATQNQRLLKESIKIDAKIREIHHQHVKRRNIGRTE